VPIEGFPAGGIAKGFCGANFGLAASSPKVGIPGGGVPIEGFPAGGITKGFCGANLGLAVSISANIAAGDSARTLLTRIAWAKTLFLFLKARMVTLHLRFFIKII
jgi:hypothetical protein